MEFTKQEISIIQAAMLKEQTEVEEKLKEFDNTVVGVRYKKRLENLKNIFNKLNEERKEYLY